MTIWADTDSLPASVRAIISRRCASNTSKINMRAIFVSNKAIPLASGKHIKAIIVGKAAAASLKKQKQGEFETCPFPDNSDDYILLNAQAGDIIVTRDIALAKKLLANNLIVINDRGTVWTIDTVNERNSLSRHMAEIRSMGLAPSVQKSRNFGPKEIKAFADAFDKAIAMAVKQKIANNLSSDK